MPREVLQIISPTIDCLLLIYQPHDIRRIDEVIAQRAILASCVRLDSCVPSVEYCLMQVPNIQA